LPQIAKNLSLRYCEDCSINVVADTIIEIAFQKKMKLGSTQLRGIQDSMAYKLFFIFRKEKDRQTYYNQMMKKISYQIDSLMEKNKYEGFSFSKYYEKDYTSLLPIVIPPTIINENYSIVVIDNTLHSSNITTAEGYLNWYHEVLTFILLLADGNKICYYQSYQSIHLWIEMRGHFGLFNWRMIKEINYPHLFKKK
jgi:hypothetical protein